MHYTNYAKRMIAKKVGIFLRIVKRGHEYSTVIILRLLQNTSKFRALGSKVRMSSASVSPNKIEETIKRSTYDNDYLISSRNGAQNDSSGKVSIFLSCTSRAPYLNLQKNDPNKAL